MSKEPNVKPKKVGIEGVEPKSEEIRLPKKDDSISLASPIKTEKPLNGSDRMNSKATKELS